MVRKFFKDKLSSRKFLLFLLVSLLLINITLFVQYGGLASKVGAAKTKFGTIQPHYGDVVVHEAGRIHNYSIYYDGSKTLLVGNISIAKGTLPARLYYDDEKSLLFHSIPYNRALKYPKASEIYGFIPIQLLNENNSKDFAENGNQFSYTVFGVKGESRVDLTLYPWRPAKEFFDLPSNTQIMNVEDFTITVKTN